MSVHSQGADGLGSIKTNATQQIAWDSNPSATERSRAMADIEPIYTKILRTLKSHSRCSCD